MAFQSIIPILYSSDIRQSISYYRDILGFVSGWEWNQPPTFGGVDNGAFHIYFCKEGQGQPGTWLAINVDDVDAYHDAIAAKGAKIVNPPETFEWGLREMLVEDPDGHRIRFGQPVSLRHKSAPSMPDHVGIVERIPSPEELKGLVTVVGWARPEEEAPPNIPQSSIASTVIAEDKRTGQVVGCAFLLTDNAGFYYVKNVIVHPAWQGKRIGTALVRQLDEWLQAHAPDGSMVALHTGPNLAPFYSNFGFGPGFSMQKKIKK